MNKRFIFMVMMLAGLAALNTAPFMAGAQMLNDSSKVDIGNKDFKLIVCDGPVLPDNVPKPKPDYVPCDFRAVMKQAQHLINIAIVVGVVLAVLGFMWAGGLMLTGVPKKIQDAKDIFMRIVKGFILMLAAWFIVYQILDWLGQPGFKALLGPK